MTQVSYVPGCTADVFVSYAHLDDRKWVEAFCENLQARLTIRSKGAPVVWTDHAIRIGDRFDPLIADTISRSALFVAIISPKYMESNYSLRYELDPFLELNGSGSGRVFQVWKTEFDGEVPLPQCQFEKFFDGKPSREFQPGQERFHLALEKLVDAILLKLEEMRKQHTHLYIGFPDRKLEADRARIVTEFEGQDYVLLSEIVGRFSTNEQIRRLLEKADLSIHIFGTEPEDLSERQFVLAQELGRPIIIATRNPKEDHRLNDPNAVVSLADSNWRADLIRLVERKTRRKAGSMETAPSDAVPADQRSIFMVFSPDDDGEWVCDLQEEICRLGAFELLQPDFDQRDPGIRREDKTSKLSKSHGVLICYGHVGMEWYREQETDVKKIVSRLPRRPVRACFEGPPTPARPSDGNVIRRFDDLGGFLERVRGQ